LRRHYKLPLDQGVLSNDRLVCPYHGACFDVKTGDIEDGPCLEHVCHYKAEETDDGSVRIHVPAGVNKLPDSRVSEFVAMDTNKDKRHFIIVGGGPASTAAVETLRSKDVGFRGRITLISREAHPFYDRVKTSKNMTEDVLKLPLSIDRRTAAATERKYRSMGVKMLLGYDVEKVIAKSHSVRIRKAGDTSGKSSQTLEYDRILCATGGPARTFKPSRKALEGFTIDGADMKGIFVLRYAGDNMKMVRAIESCSKNKKGGVRVVIVGASFIGMEAASALEAQFKIMKDEEGEGAASGGGGRSKKPAVLRSVHIVDMAPHALGPMGAEVGNIMEEVAEKKGVSFRLNHKLLKFVPSEDEGDDQVGSVLIADNSTGEQAHLPADVVVIGAGMVPITDYLDDNDGIETKMRETRGGVKVDEFMCAGQDVYVAGDIAAFPLRRPGADEDEATTLTRVEHWNVATDLGRVAARNMGGLQYKYNGVPFFW